LRSTIAPPVEREVDGEHERTTVLADDGEPTEAAPAE